MKNILLLIGSIWVSPAVFAENPVYTVQVKSKTQVHVIATFALTTDKVSMFVRGTTPELPIGEAGMVQHLKITTAGGIPVSYNYAGGDSGDWLLSNVKPGEKIKIEYDLLTEHNKYNWDFTGGVDEVAFVNNDGIFFTGYALFIFPDIEMKDIKVQFELPKNWISSTPWDKTGQNSYLVSTGRYLLNNCFMLGEHEERLIKVNDFEMNIAIARQLSYASPLLVNAMGKILPAYHKLFGGSVAKKYLVVINEEKMSDGSAFRRSYSQIVNGKIDKKGTATWGYLMAHELLHLWNGFAFEAKQQEEWFKEGFTDYVTIVTLSRTKLISEDILFKKLENIARRYWLDRMWQRDTVSIQETGNQKAQKRFGVYGGGAMIAFALDVMIRKDTHNKKGLDDVMQKVYAEFGESGKKYDANDILRIVNTVSRQDYTEFFKRYVTGKEWLDMGVYLKEIGLDFHTVIEEMYISKLQGQTALQRSMYEKIFITK